MALFIDEYDNIDYGIVQEWVKDLAAEWRNLEDAQKQPYLQKANGLLKKYNEDLKQWYGKVMDSTDESSLLLKRQLDSVRVVKNVPVVRKKSQKSKKVSAKEQEDASEKKPWVSFSIISCNCGIVTKNLKLVVVLYSFWCSDSALKDFLLFHTIFIIYKSLKNVSNFQGWKIVCFQKENGQFSSNVLWSQVTKFSKFCINFCNIQTFF